MQTYRPSHRRKWLLAQKKNIKIYCVACRKFTYNVGSNEIEMKNKVIIDK